MPGIEDWINSPLQIIKGLFGEDSEAHNAKVREYFEKKLADKNAISWIPSLNDTPPHNLRTNTLVRFRGMIQDMNDPEFYLGVYEVENKKSGQKRLVSGKYSDLAECGPNEEIKVDSPRNVTMDRQTLYCVPVPGENTWVKEMHAHHGKTSAVASTSSGSDRLKRPLDNDVMESEPAGGCCEGQTSDSKTSGDGSMDTELSESSSDSKKSKTDSASASTTSVAPDLKFPLQGEKGPACIVKLYGKVDSFKVNDVVDFLGIVSNDPALATFPDSNKAESSAVDGSGEGMEGVEEQILSPPPSLVPRLHVLLSDKLQHVNPLLPGDVQAESYKPELEALLQQIPQVREEALAVLTQALMGDKLAAEYTLCHLLSSIYARHDVVAVGKFSLNLTGCPRESVLPQRFYSLLEQLVTKSHLLPMTLTNLNGLKYLPHKDYQANRLATGLLQLSDHTNLVLDETAMQPGQLDATGVKNITSLGNLVLWQKVDYDFQFHQQPFPTDIKVLVLSEGKSLLKSDCRLPLSAEIPADKIEAQYTGIASYLTPALLTKLRTYLGLVQLLSYSLPDDLQKEMEEDFVNRRKDDPNNMTVEDFQSLLVLTRLLSLSLGQTILCRDTWRRAKTLEGLRKQRISN